MCYQHCADRALPALVQRPQVGSAVPVPSRTEHITACRAAEDPGEGMEEVKGGSFHHDPMLCAYRDEEEAELPSETLPSLQVQQVCTVGMWWDVTQGFGCLGRGEQQHTGLLPPHFGWGYLETEAGKLSTISNGYTLCQAFCFLFSSLCHR